MSYLVNNVMAAMSKPHITCSGSDFSWASFYDAVAALRKHGTITRVSRPGNWNDRFIAVTGEVAGVAVTLYSPRYIDEKPVDETTVKVTLPVEAKALLIELGETS